MSITSRIYTLITFKKFKELKKINYYFRQIGAHSRFLGMIRKKSENLEIKLTNYSFSPHNPITGGIFCSRWICESYHAAFDFLDNKYRPKSLLEIGCGYGLSTWLLNDGVSGEIKGIDINKEAIKVASHLFDCVEYECVDYIDFFNKNPKAFYDVILVSRGPVKRSYIPTILNHCNKLIFIGYRAKSIKDFLFWKHKLKGKQLSYSTSVCEKNKRNNSISPLYFKYFFTWHYLQALIHSIQHRYFFPL